MMLFSFCLLVRRHSHHYYIINNIRAFFGRKLPTKLDSMISCPYIFIVFYSCLLVEAYLCAFVVRYLVPACPG